MKKMISSSFGAISILTMALMFNIMSNNEAPRKIAPKKVASKISLLKNGWADINRYRTNLAALNFSTKKLKKKARKDLVGKTVRFNGYVKLLRPQFANNFEYYLTKETELNCLPIAKSEAYCGNNNPNYFGVIFNGDGASDRDMKIMLNPHENQYISANGVLTSRTLEDGNYIVNTYEKRYLIQAIIKDIQFDCLNENCTENDWTVHIDQWKFIRIP